MFKKSVLIGFMVALCMVLLAACGSNSDEPAAAGNVAPAAGQGAGEASDAAGEEATAPASASASASVEVVIAHALGTATVPVNPAKVVVFDYATLDTLDKLGIEVAALPQATLPGYLAKFASGDYDNAGTLFEPDFEKLSVLKPDVIFIGARTVEAYEELNKIAPTIPMSLDYANYSASFEHNLNVLGQIFNKEAEIAAELAAIKAAISDLNGKAASAGKALILLTNGGKISAYGPGSRFGIIHEAYGFAPVDDSIEVSPHGQSISNEYIAEKNPDVIFVVDRGSVAGGSDGASAKETVENELVKKTNAYANGKIIYLDANYWYLSGGGLVSDAAMVREAAQAVE